MVLKLLFQDDSVVAVQRPIAVLGAAGDPIDHLFRSHESDITKNIAGAEQTESSKERDASYVVGRFLHRKPSIPEPALRIFAPAMARAKKLAA